MNTETSTDNIPDEKNPRFVVRSIFATIERNMVYLIQRHELFGGNKSDVVYLAFDDLGPVIERLQKHQVEIANDIMSRQITEGPIRKAGGGTSNHWEYAYIGLEGGKKHVLNGYGSTSAEAKETATKQRDKWLAERDAVAEKWHQQG